METTPSITASPISPKVDVGLQHHIEGSLHKWFRLKRNSLRSIAKKLNRDVFRKCVQSLNFDEEWAEHNHLSIVSQRWCGTSTPHRRQFTQVVSSETQVPSFDFKKTQSRRISEIRPISKLWILANHQFKLN